MTTPAENRAIVEAMRTGSYIPVKPEWRTHMSPTGQHASLSRAPARQYLAPRDRMLRSLYEMRDELRALVYDWSDDHELQLELDDVNQRIRTLEREVFS